MSRRKVIAPLAAAAVASAALAAVPLHTAVAAPDGTGLVISEAYGGGGNSGATYTHDFVELYNPTDEAISVDGMSIQYRAAGGTSATQVTELTGSVPADGYYLIQQGQGAGGTVPLPTADVVGTIAMGGTGFRVWLADGTDPITPQVGAVEGTEGIVDFVGAGSAVSWEGTGPAPAPSNTNSVARSAEGTDTDDNAADLTAGAPSPASSGSEPEPPEEVDLTIAEIQGTGAASEHVGDIATTRGVVTAAYPSGGLFGFYLQTPGTGGETDPATRTTSDGVFVRVTQAAGAVTVEPGDHVEVTGKVTEYAGQTQVEIGAAADIVALTETAEPVTPTTSAWPTTDVEKERLEGMLYLPTGRFTVSNTYFNGSSGQPDAKYGEVGLAQGDKPLIQPTEVADAQSAAAVAAVVADNAARAIVLDDGSSFDFSSRQDLTPAYVSTNEPVSVGAAVTFVDPVIFTEGGAPTAPSYRFQPTETVTGPANADSPADFDNIRTTAPDEARLNADGNADLKVASFNVLNYFTTLGDADDDNVGDGGCTSYNDREGDGNNVRGGCDQRGAWDPEDLERQQDKIVTAINALDADVVGLMEIENSAALGEVPDEATETLVAALNAAAGAGTWAANPSSTDLPPVADQDVITNAIIYKPAAVERVDDSVALGTESSGDGAFNNAREPIGQVFAPVGGGEAFLYVVNHFKSKGSGVDDGTGQGNANPDRIAQAVALSTWVDAVKEAGNVEAVLLGGDFNSYTMEDPLQVLYDAGYVNATSEFGADEWSYSFGGQSGSLDHILLNEAARALTTGSDIWNINAGESLLMEYSRFNYTATDFQTDGPYRSSDHDPVLVGLDLAADEPVEKVKPRIKVKVTPKKVWAKKTRVKVKVVITAPGRQVDGQVTVAVAGKKWIVGLKRGKATLRLPAFAHPGPQKIRVVRDGDETFKKAKEVVTIRVVRKRTR